MNVVLAEARPAVTAGSAASFLRRYEAIRDRLPGDPQPRARAAASLERHGLPQRSAEAWKYTDLRRLWEGRFGEAAASADAAGLLRRVLERAGLDVEGADALPRLVFVDGLLSDALSRLPQGYGCAGFEGIAVDAPVAHPMMALNAMLARDGAVIRVPAGLDAGRLLLVTLAHGDAGAHLHHRVMLEDGARLSLLEIAGGEGEYLNEGVFAFEIAAGAHVSHVRLQQDAPAALSFSTVRVHLAERSAYDGFNLALGAALARHEVHATLAGPHAIVHVNGAQLLADSQVADLSSVIAHDAPACNSRQTVKNVLTGRSRGVFQGKIVVARVAQKTDGYQMNQVFIVSEKSEIYTKPELEIYADDVKCSHGATAGALDEEQLFYMRSRGVPLVEARAILVRAFLDDALALVEDEMARMVLDRAVAAWWEGRTA